MTDPLHPKITCHGTDGSVWRYFAFYGPDLAPAETCWVLVVDGVPGLQDGQRLTAAEVVADVASMVDDPAVAREIVRLETRQMLQMLEARRFPHDPGGRIALVLRIAELRHELDDVS